MAVKEITVASKGKWDVKDVAGQDFSFTKDSGLNNSMLHEGEKYTVEFSQWKGRNYIKKILAGLTMEITHTTNGAKAPSVMPTPPIPVQEKVTTFEKKSEPKTKVVKPMAHGKELSDYELKKDLRISLQGLVQSLLSSPVMASVSLNLEDAVERAKTSALDLLNFIEKEVEGRSNRFSAPKDESLPF